VAVAGEERGWPSYDDLPARPRQTRSADEERRSRRRWRVGLILGVGLMLVVALAAGALPGSSAVGRYPVWDLYALEARIEDGHGSPLPVCSGWGFPDAQVDLVASRVVVATSGLELSDDERAMVIVEDEPAPLPDLEQIRPTASTPTAPGSCF
jgi:hypothetical protein